MKTSSRVLAIASLLTLKTVAAPFVAVGDNAELFLTSTVGVSHDDNIYTRSSGEVSDTILEFTPGVDFVFGRNAATSGNVYYKHQFLNYSDNSSQNTNLPSLGINTLYKSGRSKFDLGASYQESSQNDFTRVSGVVTGQIIQRKLTNLRGLGEFGLTEKTSLGAGATYAKTDYSSSGFRDSDVWELPVDVYFSYSPKLETSVGYRYRSTELNRSTSLVPSSKDHFLNIGARGEFTPKLSGQVRLGWVKRSFDNGRDKSDFGAQANLTLAASAKTNLNMGLGSDFGSGPGGESITTKSVSLGASTRLDEQWSFNANLAYRDMKYPTRSDNFTELGLGMAYTVNAYVNVAGSYTHRSQASDVATSEFKSNVFSLSANIRY